MLEHVALDQTRYVTPGLAADARGIALGRHLLVLLPTLDRVVAFLRGLAESGQLPDLLPGLTITRLRTTMGARELAVQLPAQGSRAADMVAAVAGLAGGFTFTGTTRHFVRYRDARSPLGYDVDALHEAPADLVLYHGDFVQAYEEERRVDVAGLVLGLQLERIRDDALAPGERALLRAERGLAAPLLGYLHRNGVSAEVAVVDTAAGAGSRGVHLVRCDALPPRMATLFRDTPGIRLHRLVLERAAVEVGFRHPVRLDACASLLAPGTFYLFTGGSRGPELVESPPIFVPAHTILSLDLRAEPPRAVRAHPAAARALQVPIRVVPDSGPRPPVAACRIPVGRVAWLKKLVYLLPPTALAGYRLCATERYIYVYAPGGVDLLPVGRMYHEVAPRVLLPVGWQLLPRVTPETLLAHLGHHQDRLTFLAPEGEPSVSLSLADFAPLGRRALAPWKVERPVVRRTDVGATDPPVELVNDPVGPFPLWGLVSRPEEDA